MNKIIKIYGARTHNLKNINLVIPRNKLIVISGVSGSGKSSLAFNTLYAEGHRRYVESLSSYVRQFLLLIEKPDVDCIEGLSPTISIKQKSNFYNPRSTVGTITEIYDYLRILFSHVGEVHCPDHNIPLVSKTVSQMVDIVLDQLKGKRLMLLAPVKKNHKNKYAETLKNLLNQGFVRARINGKVYNLNDLQNFRLKDNDVIEVVVDRFIVCNNIVQRLAESFEIALELSGGTVIVTNIDSNNTEEQFFSSNCSCPICGYSIYKLDPHLFSFNNPSGACQICNGLGIQQYFDSDRVIQNPNLSLANNAIYGWGRHNFYHFQIIKSLAEHYTFDVEAPWNTLSEIIRKVILYGSGKENIKFKYINYNCNTSTLIHYHPFDGILYNMERLYKETKSGKIRDRLSKFLSNRSCTSCNGTRLRREAHYVFLQNTTLPTISNMSIKNAINFFKAIKFSGHSKKIAEKILKEITSRLRFLSNLGLNYLTLSRSVETLSRGEAQRVRLANHIGSGLVGVIYVLDEPSIGLHRRDNKRLINMLMHLRNLGNTVIVVEHDKDAIRSAEHIIDIGPGAGVHGGYIIAEGSLEKIMAVPESLTGQYMIGRYKIATPKRMVMNQKKVLELIGASGNNLKDVTLVLPVGLLTCITGVSGSGKSTLINDTLLLVAQFHLNGLTTVKPAPYRNIKGMEYFNKVINIDQSPVSKTSRSNIATYIGIFKFIRKLFASVPESRSRGYTSKRFSFNMYGGRCEACQGDGVIKATMYFLPDVCVLCDQCQGKQYNRETLEIKYKGKTIHEVLKMTITEAREFFHVVPTLVHKLQILINVGLDYIHLGKSVNTLSDGEAQRIKIARELSKYSTNQTLYILDEPTTGLHFSDIQKLLDILYQLRDKGNTIVVIEHNLDVIKTADWIIDLGPEGGDNGGEIIASGTPEMIINCKNSYTARFLT